MRFSIVIPTHNRLHLLRDAIETVRRQDFADWELVVFDNASTDPIGEHVASLADDRIRYARSDDFLPVTSSWNEAMRRARGEYVLLLGDDDGLTPNYFRRMDAIISQFHEPEVVYNNIYQFWHPGVAPWEPLGHVIEVRHGFFFKGRDQPFLLAEQDARQAVLGSIRLRINFSFNSQALLYKQSFLEKLCSDGPIYRSPFPDYYIANVALMRSRSTVIVPEPLAIAGVSKASFGFTMYNGKESEGEAMLNTKLETDPVYQSTKQRLLPGPAYNTNFVIAMEYVARALPELGKQVDYQRYRRIQIFSALKAVAAGHAGADLWEQIKARISFPEQLWGSAVLRIIDHSRRSSIVRRLLLPPVHRAVSLSGFNPMVRHCGKHNFSRVTDLYDAFANGTLS